MILTIGLVQNETLITAQCTLMYSQILINDFSGSIVLDATTTTRLNSEITDSPLSN